MACESSGEDIGPKRTQLWGAVIFPKLSSLWKLGLGCDVTLVCHDGSVKAPSVLLCALSEKLHKLIILSEDSILTFFNISVMYWHNLLDLIYSGKLNDQSVVQTSNFVTTLLVANALEMNETMSLFNHLLMIEKDKDNLFDTTKVLAALQDLHIECSYNTGGNSFTTVISNEDFSKITDIFQNSPAVDIHPVTEYTFKDHCISCQEKCIADKIQCVYCFKVLFRKEGVSHIKQNHEQCESNVLPYNCFIDHSKTEEQQVKGQKMIVKSKVDDESFFLYKCNLCDYSTRDTKHFADHFLVHGFFPYECWFCGDVFCDARIQKYHIEYCGKQIREYEGTIQLPKLEEVCCNDKRFENEESEDYLELEGYCSTEEMSNSEINQVPETSVPKVLPKCILCFDKCIASQVMCLLCNQIVWNDLSHMESEHSRSKNANVWAYTCNIQSDEETSSQSEMIVSKDIIDGIEWYKCRKCLKKYKGKEMMFLHLRAAHGIMSAFYCSHCDSGFTDLIHRNSHQHLCGGGDYIQCSKCKVFFGSEDLLKQHSNVCLRHHKKSKQTKVSSRIDSEKDSDVDEPEQTIHKEGDMNMWKQICYTCVQPCNAKKVKCIYCFKIVENSTRHMEESHPFTPKTSMFVYTCKYLKRTAQSDTDWVICIKEQIAHKNCSKEAPAKETSSYQFRCLKCQKTFTSISDVRVHMKKKHKIHPKMCRICDFGFVKQCHLKDHQHFCSGGELLFCKICSKEVGCFKTYYDHRVRHHPENLTDEKRSKPNNKKSKPKEEVIDKNRIDEAEDKKNKASETVLFSDESCNQEFDVNDKHLLTNFQMVQREKPVNAIKVCLYCNDNCNAESVCCLYCLKTVLVKDQEEHIRDVHESIPNSHIWPVQCKSIENEIENQVVALPVREWSINEKEKTMIYKCNLCVTSEFDSQESVTEHVSAVHQKQCYFCVICGVGLQTKSFKLKHEHFCSGNDVVKCLLCNDMVGTWQRAYCHKDYCKAVNTLEDKVGKRPLPKRIKKAKGEKYGYNILCADCKGQCDAKEVKCGLCSAIVPLDDIHMKMCHPYSSSTSWIVYCRLNYSKTKDEKDSKVHILGGRIAIGDALLAEESCIPTKLPYNYKCNLCSVVTAEKQMLVNHIAFAHDEKTVFHNCNTCDAMMTSKPVYMDHSRFCSKGILYQCDQCDQVLGSYNRYLSHKFVIHPKRKYDEKFSPVKGNEIPIPKGTILECAECDFKTPTYATLKDHNLTVHNYKKHQVHMICRVCYKVFRLKSELEKHHQQVHLNGQRCLCDSCGKDFEYPMQLKRHVRYYHKGERETSSIMHKFHRPRKICPQCGVVYKTTSALTRHIRVIHEKNFYQCNSCHKKFYSTSGLKNHMYRHTGEKRYSCPHCNYRGFRSRDVNNHVLKHHPGNPKPYVQTFVLANDEMEAQKPSELLKPQV